VLWGWTPTSAPEPQFRLPQPNQNSLRSLTFPTHCSYVALYRRRLPHTYQTENPVFLTWRLYGSLPANRRFPRGTLTAGQQFAVMDRLLGDARSGPFFLRQATLAELVVEAIHYNAQALGQSVLQAFVVMPNHVHLLVTPKVPIPQLTKSLKGITARRANQILGQTGRSFWQEETYDHEVRGEHEMEGIRFYIENDPVRAGLVALPGEYRWSSAGWSVAP
jgi:putative transposase